MAQQRGPFGGPPSLRRHPGDDPFGAPQQPAGNAPWPPQPQPGYGYGEHPVPPPQAPYFPSPDPQAGYGFGQQPMLMPQQWGQPGEPHAQDVAYHQNYGDHDPSPFAQPGQVHHHQGYADSDMEMGDGYYEDEEPRRGRRWLLIAVALVGAIGVGGALAYTYRSIVAPKGGRVVASKSEPVKVKVGNPAPAPIKAVEPPPAPKAEPPPPQEEPASGGGEGPRPVKTIPIVPGGGATASVAPLPTGIPGLSIIRPPSPTPPAADPAPSEAAPPASPGRVKIGVKPAAPTPPPAPAAEEPEEASEPAAPPPTKSKQASLAASKPAPSAASKVAPAPTTSTGSGVYVAVVKAAKSSMDATKTYADLQQDYPQVLSGTSVEVQEVDLSARGLGTMYRVLVGPPGSRNWASNVCSQLKAAGYQGCWVKEY